MVAVSERMRGLRDVQARAGSAGAFVGLLALAPALLGVARLLPAEGAGLVLRLTAAAACVLLVPGAAVVRALGRPAALSTAAAAAFAWSLALLAGALLLTFALDGSIVLTLLMLAGATGVALVVALLRPAAVSEPPGERAAALGVAAAGAGLAGAVWWTANTIQGDALFHLGRVRKLEALDPLSSVNVVDEFRDGGLHPGYAFPLWHAALALVARLAGVDPATVVRHLPAILTPLALVLAYAAGAALFRSWGGGIATAAAQGGLLAFARAGTGSFDFLSLPSTAARMLLVPALLAIVFSYVAESRLQLLPSVAAAGLALALVHPTYAFFIALPLVGFLAVRLALAFGEWAEAGRIAGAVAAVLAPAGLYALWLKPIAEKAASHEPDQAQKARDIAHYAGQLDLFGDSFRLAPEMISRGGAIAVAGLLAAPLAVLAARRRWAAYVLGSSVLVLALVLVPATFTGLADAVSLSQARRVVQFLPFPFALAGAATLLGRLQLAGCLGALAAGITLQALYPGEFSYRFVEGGPAWPVWACLTAGAVALLAGAVARRSVLRAAAAPWTAAVALSFVAPIAVDGFADLSRDKPDPYALTPGLVRALKAEVKPRQVVWSDLETSYRIAAYAPVYIAVAPPAHVADTTENRPYERRRDAKRFFRRHDLAIPRRYGADWIVIAKGLFDFGLPLPRVYQDGRFALYRLE